MNEEKGQSPTAGLKPPGAPGTNPLRTPKKAERRRF
ncbi:MAG: hypothetical protein K0R85_1847 [Devosia sp.]|jgi:hypothetical protein|nr:hypothetical protein [Devosia sp.]